MSTSLSSSENLQRLAKLFPRMRKQRYLLSLSEDDFRDLVVRPIFLTQGFTDGRDTCGPSEQGKDCYFTKTSDLSGTDVIVVQTKKGKITKASTPKNNLDTIVAQLRTALETGVLLVADKKKTIPIQAFLAASGEINDNARQHINDQLSNPRLKFIDAETLIPLIDLHKPELWLNIDSDAIAYFQAVCRAIELGNELIPGGLALGQAHSNASVLDDAYANVYVFRAKRKLNLRGQRRRKKKASPRLDSLPVTSLIN
jgi:Restriction endonuclease